MTITFPPGREADLLAWALNAQALFSADPAAYGLVLDQSMVFMGRVNAFQALYNECNQPGTRTPTKIEAKKLAKKALITEARGLIAIVQAFPGTTDDMRRDLDISIRDYEPTPVPVPVDPPVLEVVAVMGRNIKIKLRPLGSDSRARPAGVKGATVYYAVGDSYPEEIASWVFKGNTARTTTDLTIPPSVPGGAKVWLTAAWFNTKSQSGPACPPIPTEIAGGLAQAG